METLAWGKGTFCFLTAYHLSERLISEEQPMRALLRPGNVYRVGIACAALLGASFAAPQVRAEEITKSFTVAGRANVHVETNDGSVRVSPEVTRTLPSWKPTTAASG